MNIPLAFDTGQVPVSVRMISSRIDPRHTALAERFNSAGMLCERADVLDVGSNASINLLCCRTVQGDTLNTVLTWSRRHPIVLICDVVEEVDRILALEIGADDVFCVEQSPREMIAKVRAIARRLALTQSCAAAIGSRNWTLRPALQRVIAPDGKSISVTPAENRALQILVAAGGKVVSRAQMIEELYPDRSIKARSADTLFCRLRRKVDRYNPPLVRTLRRGGYYLDCPIDIE